MKSINKIIVGLLAIVFVQQVNAQLKERVLIKVDHKTGNHYNILNSPDFLFDRGQEVYVPQDSFMKSSMASDFGASVKYKVAKRKKFEFEVASRYWTRRYFSQSEFDQTRITSNVKLRTFLNKKNSFNFGYTNVISDEILTTIMAAEAVREVGPSEASKKPLEYISNNASAWYQRKTRYLDFNAGYGLQFRNYYKDTSTTNLLSFAAKRGFADLTLKSKSGNKLTLDASYADRLYGSYLALDSTAKRNTEGILRVYHISSGGLSYAHEITEKLTATPSIRYRRVRDVYQDFFSKRALSYGMKLRFKTEGFYLSTGLTYGADDYDVKVAPSYQTEQDLLHYDIWNYNLSVNVPLTSSLKVTGTFAYEYRNTNTELHFWTTRRDYTHYRAMVGLNWEIMNLRKKNGSIVSSNKSKSSKSRTKNYKKRVVHKLAPTLPNI